MATTALVGVNTIMDIVNSYTSLDTQAQYIWAAKVLARKCPFFEDMPMFPSNQIFSNIGARQTYLPTPGTRRFNEGVSPTAVHTTPYTEGIAMIEDYSDVDKTLCDIQANPAAWRQERDGMKLEAMTQKAEDLIVYGSIATDPNAFQGLITRFNSLTSRPNGDTTWPYNVLNAGGGGGDTASILIVQWGQGKVFGIYPKNLPAGIKAEDLGEVTVVTNSLASPKYYQGYRSHMALYFGINVEDERCVQRLCNIETSGVDNIFDPEDLITLINRLPGGGADARMYVSRSIKTQMEIAAMNKNNAFYTVDSSGDVWGRPVLKFRGIPVRLSEMLDETESEVT